LFEEYGLREEVQAALRKDLALDEADREFALQLAQTHSENPLQLSEAAWKVIKTRDARRDAYSLALRQAETAVHLDPRFEFGHLDIMLGVAEYRVGRYASVHRRWSHFEKYDAVKEGIAPEALAFLAMAQHQLDKKAQAKVTLDRLRTVMKQPRWAQNSEAAGFLREAEELIEGKARDKRP
jgi:hypothetical protein